jgi:hypothetical protein
MELSLLCDIQVSLCVLDKNNRLLLYTTDTNTLKLFSNFFKKKVIQGEYLTNEDVNIIIYNFF